MALVFVSGFFEGDGMLNLLAAGGRVRLSRRQLLGLGSQGAFALALQPLLLAEAASTAGAAAVAPRATAKARHCIYIFLCGGPSQLDLWDPKPDASERIRGPFSSIDTSVPGVRFTDLIPRVAALADKLAVIRSMHHGSADHNFGIAHTLLGQLPAGANDLFVSRRDHPALGAILHKLRGDCGVLPPWVTLPRPFTTLSPPHKGQSAGFLGAAYDSVTLNEPKIDSLAPKELRLDALDRPKDVSPERLEGRRRLLAETDLGPVSGAETQVRWDQEMTRALEMIAGPDCRRAFDLGGEPTRIRDRYGRNEYGQSFLLARRLVESGVRMVNVFWTYFDKAGCQFNLWDNHGVTTEVCGVGGILSGEQMMRHPYCTPSFDQAFSALLEDLEQRGLLDETLVVVAGEFGRTPKINNMAGRDHWPFCYSQLLAGGGVRGGQVFGASDKTGGYVKDSPVTPDDFAATILHAFGVDPGTMIEDAFGRPFRLSPGTPLASIFG